jgi:hypothetical protein
MDNMDGVLGKLKNSIYEENSGLSPDFENQVFAKIKRKKVQRKRAVSAVVCFAIAGFLYLGKAFVFQHSPVKDFSVQTDTYAREEIPVIEDVIFASYDEQTDYAIEHVAYYESEDTI